MHEMALCESILQVIEDQAAAQNFSAVKSVHLEIGPLAGVERDALEFGFDVVMRGTLADGATLRISEPPATAWCLPCAETVAIKERFDACPHCGSRQLQVTGGEELRIKDMEVM